MLTLSLGQWLGAHRTLAAPFGADDAQTLASLVAKHGGTGRATDNASHHRFDAIMFALANAFAYRTISRHISVHLDDLHWNS
jgi:hypothetical protein